MLAARFRIAFQQDFVAGVQIQHIAADAAAAQFGAQRRNLFDFIGTIARIEPHGGSRIAFARAANRVGNQRFQ